MHARVVHMWSLQSLTRVSYFSVTVSSISREVYTVTIRSSARKIRYPVRRAFSRDMLRLRLRFCRRRATSCACRSPLEVANVVDRMTSWMKNIQQWTRLSLESSPRATEDRANWRSSVANPWIQDVSTRQDLVASLSRTSRAWDRKLHQRESRQRPCGSRWMKSPQGGCF